MISRSTVQKRTPFLRVPYGIGVVALIVIASGAPSALGQTRPSTDTCLDLRAPDTHELLEAVGKKKPKDIAQALGELSRLPRFSIPNDPTEGRRPVRSSYAIRFSDRQLERRAASYLEVVTQSRARRAITSDNAGSRPVSLGDIAGTIRSLLALAQAFPTHATTARKLARDMGDGILRVSQRAGTLAAPLAPPRRALTRNPFMRATLPGLISSCPALKQQIASGWLVAAKAPELHYADTARVGEAFIALTRDTGEQRFLQWTRNASGWFSRHIFVADVQANAMAAGLDAELFILSAEEKYLIRALDRVTHGVLPAFEVQQGEPNFAPFARRLSLDALANIARSLVKLSTAIAAAPLGIVTPTVRQRVQSAVQYAHQSLQTRAGRNRRLQYPPRQIELAIDIERAQRAGADLSPPDPEAFRHVLAHGADRLQRFIPLGRAAHGLLLAKLKERGWSGAHRTTRRKRSPATSE